jgi:sulfatase modifying factor 1
MRLASSSLLAVGGAALLAGCGGGFDPTYVLTCPSAVTAKTVGAVSLAYTASDPIIVEWRITPANAGTFGQLETPGAATNEGEPVTIGTQLNAQTAGSATIDALVDSEKVASCAVEILPEGVEPVTLTLVVAGMGSVSGSVGGLACPGTCAAEVAPGTAVTLTPTPATNWTLGGVTGGCADAGDGTYTVSPSADTTCTFTFMDASNPGNTVMVPAGAFTRGCEGGCSGDSPLGTVTLSQAFRIDVTEVTVSDYKACVDAGACTAPGSREPGRLCNWGEAGRDMHPVNCVSWSQASAYCGWRGQALPTEAQWERAARGAADQRTYPWGDDNPTCDQANIVLVPFMRCAVGTSSVAVRPAGISPVGAEDMVGNVAEWVADWYDATYYGVPSSQVDPAGPASSPDGNRGVRGGGYNTIQDLANVYDRSKNTNPERQEPDIGFRCVTN